MLSVWTWDGVEARRFSWEPPSSQAVLFPAATWEPAVRMVLTDDGPEPLAKIAALSGWWTLDNVFLTNLASKLGIELREGNSFMDTLLQMTMTTLGCTEASALQYLRRRLASAAESVEFVEELLEVDEAQECLDSKDEQKLGSCKDQMRDKLQDQIHFHEEFRKAAQRAHDRENPDAAAPKRKRGRNAAASSSADRHLPDSIEGWTHAQAKEFMPPGPGSKLWRGYKAGTWNARIEPFPQVSPSIRTHGDGGALRIAICHAWRQWCDMNGVRHDDCPVANIDFTVKP